MNQLQWNKIISLYCFLSRRCVSMYSCFTSSHLCLCLYMVTLLSTETRMFQANHGCWCPGSLCHQVISNNGSDCGINRPLNFTRKYFNNLCHLIIEEWVCLLLPKIYSAPRGEGIVSANFGHFDLIPPFFFEANDKIWAKFDQFHAKLLENWLT